MHEQVHCCGEAASHQLPHSCGLLNHPNISTEECSSLTQNLMQIHCSTHSVILNLAATQYTCSLNGVYHPHWLVQWSHHCSHMRIPVRSPWLPSYIDVLQTVLIILTMAGLFLDRPCRPQFPWKDWTFIKCPPHFPWTFRLKFFKDDYYMAWWKPPTTMPCLHTRNNLISTATMRNGMEASRRIEDRATIRRSSPSSGYPPGKSDDTHSWRYVHPYVHCSITHGGPDAETSAVSFRRRPDKEDGVRIYKGTPLGHKKRWNAAIRDDVDGPSEYHSKWNKPDRRS